jgi:hypothetical protein
LLDRENVEKSSTKLILFLETSAKKDKGAFLTKIRHECI